MDVTRDKMLRDRCEDMSHVDYVLLTYYRSGTTLLKHLIHKCGCEVIHFHLNYIENFGYFDEKMKRQLGELYRYLTRYEL